MRPLRLDQESILRLTREAYTVRGGGVTYGEADIGDGVRVYRLDFGMPPHEARTVEVETATGPVSIAVALVTIVTADGKPLAWSPCTRGEAKRVIEYACEDK